MLPWHGGLGRLPAASWKAWQALAFRFRLWHSLSPPACSRQKIIDGVQIELPEDWLVHGKPMELSGWSANMK